MHTCVETEDVGSDFRMTKSIILFYFLLEHEKKSEALFSSAAFLMHLGEF